jgi:hypothetical protein
MSQPNNTYRQMDFYHQIILLYLSLPNSKINRFSYNLNRFLSVKLLCLSKYLYQSPKEMMRNEDNFASELYQLILGYLLKELNDFF